MADDIFDQLLPSGGGQAKAAPKGDVFDQLLPSTKVSGGVSVNKGGPTAPMLQQPVYDSPPAEEDQPPPPMSAPRQMPGVPELAPVQPNNSFGQFVGNIGKDIGQVGQAIGVLGSAAAGRLNDAITPQALYSPGGHLQGLQNLAKHPWETALQAPTLLQPIGNPLLGQKPLFRIFGNQNEPSDISRGVNVAGDVLQNYAEHYIDPLYHLNPNRDQQRAAGIEKPLAHAYEHPLMTLLDLLPVGEVPGATAKAALKVADKVLPVSVKAPIISKVAAANAKVTSLKGAVTEKMIGSASKLPGAQSLGGLLSGIKDWKTINKILLDSDANFRREFNEWFHHVKEAYDKIPKGAISDEELSNAVTLADPEKYFEVIDGPHGEAVAEFAKRLTSVNKWLASRLKSVGALTHEEADAAQYGEYTLHRLNNQVPEPPSRIKLEGNAQINRHIAPEGPTELTADGPIPRAETTEPTQYDHTYFETPEGKAAIQESKLDLADAGAEPAYLGIIKKNLADKVRSQLGQPFGGISKAAKKAALDADAEKPGFLRARTTGTRAASDVEKNALNAFAVRLQQELGFLNARDAVEKMLKHPDLKGPGKTVPLKAHLEDLAKGAGLNTPEWSKLLAGVPETVRLPGQVAKRLEELLTGQDDANKIVKALFDILFDIPNQIFKTGTLALNLPWAVNQTIQNGIITAYSMFKGPEDFARSTLAFFMANDPKLKHITDQWRLSAFADVPKGDVPEVAKLETNMSKVMAGVVKPFQRYANFVYGVATEGDNYFRVVKGVHSLMREVETAEPEARVPLAKAFDIMARYDQIEKAAANPEIAAKAVSDIRNWFWDYGPEMARQWQNARRVFPFFLWYQHAFSIVKTAAVETPVKNAVLAQMAQVLPPKIQNGLDDRHKQMGMVPMFDPQGNRRVGPNGGDLAYGRSGYLPFNQPFELAAQVGRQMEGNPSAETPQGLPVMTPAINMGVMMSGKNPQNMAPWSNPSLIHSAGRQFRTTGEDTVEQVDARPNPAQLLGRALAPTQERQLRETLAGKYAASDFTDFSGANPRRNGEDQPLVNFPIGERLFYGAFGNKPTEVNLTQEEADAMKEAQQKKALKVRDRFQSEREKRVPTVIEQLLGAK